MTEIPTFLIIENKRRVLLDYQINPFWRFRGNFATDFLKVKSDELWFQRSNFLQKTKEQIMLSVIRLRIQS